MDPLLIIIFAILFVIVLLAMILGLRVTQTERKKRVEQMLATADERAVESQETAILKDRAPDDALTRVLKRFDPTRRLAALIQQAGLDWSVPRLLIMMLAGAAVGLLIGWRFPLLGFPWITMLVAAAVLGLLPYFYVRIKRYKRINEIEEQLPEALDFLARSMRAGHAFSVSLEMLGEELPGALGQEFRVLFNELNLGAPIDVALSNFVTRIPLLDAKIFASSVLLQRQTGGNLSEILVRLAYIIRQRFQLRGQVRAASAHGRMTAAVLTVLPVVVVFALLIVAPGYLQGMAKDPDGKWMIGGAVVGQVLGYFVMRRITDIKV